MTVLSTYAEWHALGIGFGSGFIAGVTSRNETLITLAEYALGGRDPSQGHLTDIDDEAAYALAGMVGGYALGQQFRSLAEQRR